jgi:hemerythrin superfamily protein
MNAVDLLESQHRQAEKLLSRLETSFMKRHRDMLMEALADELSTHALIEEHKFYPAVRAASPSENPVLNSLEVHLNGIRRLLAEMVTVDAAATVSPAQLRCLKENVEHHVRKEELELFPRVKRRIDAKELRDLGAALEVKQHRIEGRVRTGSSRSLAMVSPTTGFGVETPESKTTS